MKHNSYKLGIKTPYKVGIKKQEKRKRKCKEDNSDDESTCTTFLGDNPFKKQKTAWLNKSDSDVFSRGNHIIFKGDVNKDNIYHLGEEIFSSK